jgi:hypothetical protein
MNRILIASAIATALFAAPAFADCAADFAKAQEAMKAVKMDDKMTAMAKDATAKITDMIAKKDEAGCAAAVAEFAKMGMAK